MSNTLRTPDSATRLVEVPTGRELARWPGALVGIEVWPIDRLARPAPPPALLAATPAAACAGSVVGQVALGYGDHSPVAGAWVQLSNMPDDPTGQRKLVRTAADGSFRVDAVPLGPHDGAVSHACFAVTIERCGQVVDVGTVEYPLVHPPTDAWAAFERFMQARLQRDDRVVLESLTDELRAKPGGMSGTATQLSNPCWYRYEVTRSSERTRRRPSA